MAIQFSVAIPAYNCAAYLEETLRSILDQDFLPDEIIVVDDGSTDSTPDVIAKFGDVVKSQRISNSGPSVARKHAIEQCRNRWIALCDSDDIWTSNHLKRTKYAIERFPNANVISSNFESFGETATNGQKRLDMAPKHWLEHYTSRQDGDFREMTEPYSAVLDFNPMYPSGLTICSDLYSSVGGIDPAYSRWQAEDSEFVRRLIAHESAQLIIDQQVTWRYRRHENNFSSIHWKNMYAKSRIIQEHIDTNIVPKRDLERAHSVIMDARGEAFDSAFWGSHYQDAKCIYADLPKSQKTLKRRIRRILSSARRA